MSQPPAHFTSSQPRPPAPPLGHSDRWAAPYDGGPSSLYVSPLLSLRLGRDAVCLIWQMAEQLFKDPKAGEGEQAALAASRARGPASVAATLFHRFYRRNSIADHDPMVVAVAACFLGCKVAEQHMKLDAVMYAAHRVLRRWDAVGKAAEAAAVKGGAGGSPTESPPVVTEAVEGTPGEAGAPPAPVLPPPHALLAFCRAPFPSPGAPNHAAFLVLRNIMLDTERILQYNFNFDVEVALPGPLIAGAIRDWRAAGKFGPKDDAGSLAEAKRMREAAIHWATSFMMGEYALAFSAGQVAGAAIAAQLAVGRWSGGSATPRRSAPGGSDPPVRSVSGPGSVYPRTTLTVADACGPGLCRPRSQLVEALRLHRSFTRCQSRELAAAVAAVGTPGLVLVPHAVGGWAEKRRVELRGGDRPPVGSPYAGSKSPWLGGKSPAAKEG